MGSMASTTCKCTVVVVVVVVQFLTGAVPLAEMAGFTPFLLQLLALRPSLVSIQGILLLQTNLLCLLLLLLLPGFLRSFSLSLATHFKIQSNPQNTIVIPSQQISIPSNSICCCLTVYSFYFNPNMSICSLLVFLSTTF